MVAGFAVTGSFAAPTVMIVREKEEELCCLFVALVSLSVEINIHDE